MNRLLTLLFVISCLLFGNSAVFAQDTVSTDGVQFTPMQTAPSSPAAQIMKTDTGKAKAGQQLLRKTTAPKIERQQQKETPWTIFITGLLGGFAAILMPCIFPMLPMTVSYFTKGAEKGSGVNKALIYGMSIIVIYVVLGLVITVLFGGDSLNSLATSGIFNLLFFLLLVSFAASFLGAFELALPSSWVNKIDQQSNRGGFIGIFFMAATLALVSFSCTGPIIGALLVQTATTEALLGPAVGMLGFSVALALPFTLFALFPGWMSVLPKSGGWLNSVKVVLGFLELAFSIKFLSNVDLAYHWHWFDREVFLVLWIAVFGLMGLYLLGKLRLSHDTGLPFLSVPRLFLAIIVLSFTMYMVPGLWGAPLKSISAFLPPMATQDFDLSAPNFTSTNNADDTMTHKYSALFDKPRGFNPFFDYEEGLAFAEKIHKPVLIDFTGHACVNCRKMEASVWTDKQVAQRINREYVLIQLYVDDKTQLAAAEQVITPEGRSIETIGNKWSYLQMSKFHANSQPLYVLLNPQTREPLVPPQGANFDIQQYLNYLDSGLRTFKH